MTALLLVLVGLLAGAAAALGWTRVRRRRALGVREQARRIAFPFTASGLGGPALGAALRIAHAESATLVPVYLAMVSRDLTLECALPGAADVAFPLLEAVEQRALRAGVPVDSRIERGRTVRHALRQMLGHERFDRVVVAAADDPAGAGLAPEDVAWLMGHWPGEIVALRAADSRAAPLTVAA